MALEVCAAELRGALTSIQGLPGMHALRRLPSRPNLIPSPTACSPSLTSGRSCCPFSA